MSRNRNDLYSKYVIMAPDSLFDELDLEYAQIPSDQGSDNDSVGADDFQELQGNWLIELEGDIYCRSRCLPDNRSRS